MTVAKNLEKAPCRGCGCMLPIIDHMSPIVICKHNGKEIKRGFCGVSCAQRYHQRPIF